MKDIVLLILAIDGGILGIGITLLIIDTLKGFKK